VAQFFLTHSIYTVIMHSSIFMSQLDLLGSRDVIGHVTI